MISLRVSEEVKDRVEKYFDKHLSRYKVVCVVSDTSISYLYKVIAEYMGGDSFKEGTFMYGTWNDSIRSLNSGHYDMSEGRVIDCVFKSEKLLRVDYIASMAIDKLVEVDTEAFMELLDEIDLTDQEREYYGVTDGDLIANGYEIF